MTNQNAPVTPLVDVSKLPNISDYMGSYPNGKTIQVTLSREQVASILASYDYGIDDIESMELLDGLYSAITTIKNAISADGE